MQLYEADSGNHRVRRLAVLIIESNSGDARNYAEVFSAQNWDVYLCYDGQCVSEALSAVKAYNFVLLSDNVPGTNAAELVGSIRGYGHKQSAVVVITDDNQTESEALAAGANDVLRRPLGDDVLLASVRRHLLSTKKVVGRPRD